MRIDPAEDYAVMSLRRWRADGHTDDQILAMVSQHTDADDVWQAAQRAQVGHVYASPAAVKAHVRRLVTH